MKQIPYREWINNENIIAIKCPDCRRWSIHTSKIFAQGNTRFQCGVCDVVYVVQLIGHKGREKASTTA